VRFVPTATQLGYALGLLFLVPLGDRLERRSLISAQMLGLSLALVFAAFSPTASALAAASVLVGICGSVAQQIVPFAAELSAPEKRGQTIGFVMSGLLCGILLGRTLAGFVGENYGWRVMFRLAIILTLLMAALVFATLPRYPAQTRATYSELLSSLITLFREEPALRRAASIQTALFASFSVCWTILALQLEKAYQLGASVAGLFGLIGTVGVLIAPVAGRIADKRGPHLVIALCSAVMLTSWLVFGLWSMVIGLVAGVILLDFGQQGALVSNQHVIYSIRPEARNRMNTIFMGIMFIGGASGSAGASVAWQMGGWTYVSIFGALLSTIPLVIQFFGKPIIHNQRSQPPYS
jgi:predicted MFS family arabinose efflux permease